LLLKKSNEYYKEEEKLSRKKEKLFTSKSYKQWGLTQEELKNAVANSYTTDKVMATQLMLPKETKNLEKIFIDYGFTLNKVLDEVNRTNVRDYKELKEHIKKTFNEYMTSLERLNEEFSDCLIHLKEDISQKSYAYKKDLIKQNLIKLSFKTHHLP